MLWPLYLRLGLLIGAATAAGWTTSVVWHHFLLCRRPCHAFLAVGFAMFTAALLLTAVGLAGSPLDAPYLPALRALVDAAGLAALWAITFGLLDALGASAWWRALVILQGAVTFALVVPQPWLGTMAGIEFVRPVHVYGAAIAFIVAHTIPASARFARSAWGAGGIIRTRGLALAAGLSGVGLGLGLVGLLLNLAGRWHGQAGALLGARTITTIGILLACYGTAGSARHVYVFDRLPHRDGGPRRWSAHWLTIVVWTTVAVWAVLAPPDELSAGARHVVPWLVAAGAAIVAIEAVLLRRRSWTRVAQVFTVASLALLAAALWAALEFYTGLGVLVAVVVVGITLQWGIAAGFGAGWLLIGLGTLGARAAVDTLAGEWLVLGLLVAGVAGVGATVMRDLEAEHHLACGMLALTGSLNDLPDIGAVAARLAETVRAHLDLDRCAITACGGVREPSGGRVAAQAGTSPPPLPDGPAAAAVRVLARPVTVAAPLVIAGQTYGEITAERSVARGGITRRLDTHLRAMAAQTAVVLHLARLSEMHQALAAALERERMQEDLHDTAAQTLMVSGLLLRNALRSAEQSGTATEDLREGVELTEQAQVLVRRFINDRPARVETRPLTGVLRDVVDAYAALMRIPIALDVEGLPAIADPLIVEVVEGAARGALANVWRHAQARAAWVTATAADGALLLSIEDDGVGVRSRPRLRPGGIRLLRRRLTRLDGTLDVLPRTPSGTEVRIRVPLVRRTAGPDATEVPGGLRS